MKSIFIIMTLFLYPCLALALSGLEAKQRPRSTRPPADSLAPPALSLGENFHLRFGYLTGNLNLNLANPNSLAETPQAGIYDDDRPISGIFSGGGVREFRTTLSFLVPLSGQLISIGAGLFNSQIGNPGKEMRKGPSRANLHLNGIALEASVMKKASRFGYTRATVSMDSMLDGELERRYLLRSDGAYRTVTSPLKSGLRMTVTGEYILNASAGFSIGLGFGLEYGTFQFDDTDSSSSLYGINYGMSVVLRI